MTFALNITQEGLFDIFASVLIFALGFMILVQYLRKKLRHLSYMWIIIFSLAVMVLANGLAVLLRSPELLIMRNYSMILLALFVVILLDSFTRDTIDPLKLSINLILSVAFVIYGSNPATVVPFYYFNGDESLMNVGIELQVVKFALLIWIAIVGIFTFWKVAAHSPRRFRGYIYLSLFGVICIGPFSLVVLFTLDLIVPGTWALTELAGSFALALGISLKSNTGFVLPFRAIRLTVITTNGGIPLFTHTWDKTSKMIDDTLFSGMIQGISGILKESVAGGEVEEIKLSNAVLLLQRAKDAKIACVLASTKTSNILRGALNQFQQRFLTTFSEALKEPNKISQFDRATDLVAQTFPFIPTYE